MPHGVPSDKQIADGEFVLIDFGAVWNGYHSDMTRTVCVGKPTDEMERVYNIVLEAQLAALEAARPGITGSKLDGIARRIIENAGYGECFGHSLGHGVGLEIHEKPNASPNYASALKPGGYLAFEIGDTQGDDVCRILAEHGYTSLERSRDYNDRERAVLAQYGRKEA